VGNGSPEKGASLENPIIRHIFPPKKVHYVLSGNGKVLHISPKCQSVSSRLKGVTSQKTVLDSYHCENLKSVLSTVFILIKMTLSRLCPPPHSDL